MKHAGGGAILPKGRQCDYPKKGVLGLVWKGQQQPLQIRSKKSYRKVRDYMMAGEAGSQDRAPNIGRKVRQMRDPSFVMAGARRKDWVRMRGGCKWAEGGPERRKFPVIL